MNIDILKILSVLPLLGHPRHSKRIAMLQKAGFMVEAIAFERNYHTSRMPNCPVERLSKISHGLYLQRILKLISALPAIRRAIKRNDLIYAFGPDMAMAALIAGWGLRRPVILEVGDIQRIQVKCGLMGYLTRLMDRYAVNSCKLLVATAPGFIRGYYREWLHTITPALVLENKLETPTEDTNHMNITTIIEGKSLVDRPLRIGYFGNLRCEWSWQVLEALALSRPNEVEIVVAGYPMNPADLPERAAKLSNVDFRGVFRSPQDLPTLYGDVDLIWGCYPRPESCDLNWRWARTNRFYESCFYQKPIISLKDSGDSIDVERYGIGLIIYGQSIERVVDVLSGISPDDLVRWKKNMLMLPRKVYVYTSEGEELASALEGLVKNNFKNTKNKR